MKPKSALRSFLALVGSSLLAISYTQAADGTWTQTTAGPFNWGDIANWNNGTGPIASDQDSTAFFTADISAAQAVTLDSNRTLGTLVFDDLVSSHNLTISGANILTLDRATGVPVINVAQSGRTLTINSQISGNDGQRKIGSAAVDAIMSGAIGGGVSGVANGFTKTGTGTLALTSNSNSYYGPTTVSFGTLTVDNGSTNGILSPNSATISVASGATLAVNRSNDVSQASLGGLGNGATVISGDGNLRRTGGHHAGHPEPGRGHRHRHRHSFFQDLRSLQGDTELIKVASL